jgi:hypothetical protein
MLLEMLALHPGDDIQRVVELSYAAVTDGAPKCASSLTRR